MNVVPYIHHCSVWAGLTDFIENCYCKMTKYWKFYERVLDNISWVFWALLIFITVFIDWIIKCFSGNSELAKTNDRFYGTKYMFLLVTDIKNLSKVVIPQYNYPKLIWMKQNISFACSNYRSNWQLIDNFCLHSSEPSRIETQRKRIVNWIATTEPRCTVNSVNSFTSSSFHSNNHMTLKIGCAAMHCS